MDDDHRQEWRDFLLRACHDLRTPLRAVRINAELLVKSGEKRDGPEFHQLLGFLVSGAVGADALVQALSNYAVALRIEPGDVPVSMNVLLKSALAKLSSEIQRNAAEVTHSELPRIHGDPDRLLQLLENLIGNAIVHRGDAAPRIHVSSHMHDGEQIFQVSDNGPGIEADDLPRIFRPFERLRRERGGAGLGLAICREIVTGHGGRIWAESEIGKGTTVYFALPVS